MGHDPFKEFQKESSEQPPCIGITGKLFGHKFMKNAYHDSKSYNNGCCWRCGYNPTKDK